MSPAPQLGGRLRTGHDTRNGLPQSVPYQRDTAADDARHAAITARVRAVQAYTRTRFDAAHVQGDGCAGVVCTDCGTPCTQAAPCRCCARSTP